MQPILVAKIKKEESKMAKTLVFEGCPACERSGFDAVIARDAGEYMMKSLQGGAIGAGSVIAIDMILPRILPALSPMVRSLLTGGLVIAGALAMKEKNPEIATGIAIGGGAIVLHKFIGSMLGRVIPTAGLSYAQDDFEGLGEDDYGQDEELGEVEVTETPYGVLIPEELGEEVVIE